MDPLEALTQILQQINELSGGGLDLLKQALGGGADAAAPEEGAPPAPPSE